MTQEQVKKRKKYLVLWNQKNREKRRVIVRTYESSYQKTANGKWRMLRSSASAKNLELSLTKDEALALISGTCIYCGVNEPIGIDRVDSLKGYTIENSVSCCSTCNYMKRRMTVKDFLSHIQRIYSYNYTSSLAKSIDGLSILE